MPILVKPSSSCAPTLHPKGSPVVPYPHPCGRLSAPKDSLCGISPYRAAEGISGVSENSQADAASAGHTGGQRPERYVGGSPVSVTVRSPRLVGQEPPEIRRLVGRVGWIGHRLLGRLVAQR